MEKVCRGSGRRPAANLSISSLLHPKNLPKVQRDASFCLQGTYGAVWSLLLAFFARSCITIIYYLSTPLPLPGARKGAGRHSVLRAKGRPAPQQQLLANTQNSALHPAGLSEISSGQGRGWAAQRKSPLLRRFSPQENSNVTTWEFSI